MNNFPFRVTFRKRVLTTDIDSVTKQLLFKHFKASIVDGILVFCISNSFAVARNHGFNRTFLKDQFWFWVNSEDKPAHLVDSRMRLLTRCGTTLKPKDKFTIDFIKKHLKPKVACGKLYYELTNIMEIARANGCDAIRMNKKFRIMVHVPEPVEAKDDCKDDSKDTECKDDSKEEWTEAQKIKEIEDRLQIDEWGVPHGPNTSTEADIKVMKFRVFHATVVLENIRMMYYNPNIPKDPEYKYVYGPEDYVENCG